MNVLTYWQWNWANSAITCGFMNSAKLLQERCLGRFESEILHHLHLSVPEISKFKRRRLDRQSTMHFSESLRAWTDRPRRVNISQYHGKGKDRRTHRKGSVSPTRLIGPMANQLRSFEDPWGPSLPNDWSESLLYTCGISDHLGAHSDIDRLWSASFCTIQIPSLQRSSFETGGGYPCAGNAGWLTSKVVSSKQTPSFKGVKPTKSKPTDIERSKKHENNETNFTNQKKCITMCLQCFTKVS